MSYVLIFVGGGLGAGSRFFLSNILNNLSIFGFAASTLLINIVGCLLIGFLMSEEILSSKSLQLFFGVGFLGSFTTFSTFTKEAIIFYEQIGILESFLYLFMTLFLCLLSTYLSHRFF